MQGYCSSSSAYSGLIKCSDCGGMISANTQKGHIYYRCGQKMSPCKGKSLKYIREEVFESDLVKAFERIEIDPQTWKDARTYVSQINEPEKAEITREMRKISEEVKREEYLQEGYGQKFTKGDFSPSQFKKLTSNSQERVNKYRSSIVKLNNLKAQLDEAMFDLLDNIKQITQRFRIATAENKRELVMVFCENLR